MLWARADNINGLAAVMGPCKWVGKCHPDWQQSPSNQKCWNMI